MLHVKMLARGNVQGVGFRDFACKIGASLALFGYAKNLPDGTVEIVAEGEPEKIDQFRKRVSVKFPIGIRVDALTAVEQKKIDERAFTSFGVRY